MTLMTGTSPPAATSPKYQLNLSAQSLGPLSGSEVAISAAHEDGLFGPSDAAWNNCQIDPAIGAAGDIDSLMVTMLTTAGRMVQMSNNRRGPLGYDQRLEAHCANEVLFIDNRPQSDIRIAGPTGALSAPPMDYFISRFEARTPRDVRALGGNDDVGG